MEKQERQQTKDIGSDFGESSNGILSVLVQRQSFHSKSTLALVQVQIRFRKLWSEDSDIIEHASLLGPTTMCILHLPAKT